MEAQLSFEAGQASHQGRRATNQDSVASYIPSQAVRIVKGALFVVADGTGPGGAWASRQGAQALLYEYFHDPSLALEESLRRAIARVNYRLHTQISRAPSYRETSSTAVLAALRGHGLYVAHVGDSRAYLFRGGQAHQLTVDHSWAAEAVARKLIKPQDARYHPWRHVLTRSLGPRPQVLADVARYRLRPGDVVLLCTDGLSDVVLPQEMLRFRSLANPQQIAWALVNLAVRRGTDDNVTALVICVGQPPRGVLLYPTPQPVAFKAARARPAPQQGVAWQAHAASGLGTGMAVAIGAASGLAAALILTMVMFLLLIAVLSR